MSNDLKNNSNKKTINIFLDIDYNTYKNRIKKYIFDHITYMYNIFDEEFNDNFAKLYILYKKDLLENKDKMYGSMLIDFYNCLKLVDNVDQEEYFYLIMKLLNIFIFIEKNIDSETKTTTDNENDTFELKSVKLVGTKYIKLINLKVINNNIRECVNKIVKENVVMELFVLFIRKENKRTKENIIFIGEKLSMDYFMYWDSIELYKIIKSHIKNSKNRLFTSIKKYKNDFYKSYNYKTNVLKDLYLDQVNTKLILKYKFLKNNDIFNEFVNDIDSIDKKINNDNMEKKYLENGV
jgi:hypothetical protein